MTQKVLPILARVPRSPTLLLVLVGVLAVCPGATAQRSPSQPYDPNSPAGTEYQLPVDHARSVTKGSGGGAGPRRQDVAPTSQSGVAQATRQPLFGAGLSKRGAPASRGKSGAGPGHPREGGSVRAAQSVLGPTGHKSALVSGIGIAAAVLLGGLIIGFLMRRQKNRPA
jgi:hypothetical protein